MKNIVIELIKKEAAEHKNSSAITGVLESIDQQSDKSTDDNAVYMLKITNYKGS